MNNYAFIDSQNVRLAILAQGWELDWKRFRKYLKDQYNISKAFLFIGYIEGNNSLYKSLQEAGFICIFKPVLNYREGKIKGNVDAELILHTMIELNNFNKAVIVSGDGDFYCLIQYLDENTKLEVVLIPNMHMYSGLLKRFAKKRIEFMNVLKDKIGRK